MEWKRGQVIGHGSSATVYLATSSKPNQIIAVKSADLSQSEPLQKEAKILSTLNNRHVITYLGNDITRDKNDNKKPTYNLLLEYLPGGSLNDVVLATKGLTETLIRHYTKKILHGLEYLHSLNITHCDIKGRNILLAGDGELKIADFGCAKTADSGAGVFAGTPMFMAPEAARGDHQGLASDIWSLGCTVIEMAGLSPWRISGGDHVGVIYRLACSEELPEFPRFFSEEGRDFLGKCLRRRPEERWTAAELLRHPFVAAEGAAVKSEIFSRFSDSPTSVLGGFADECFGRSEVAEGDSAAERIGRLRFDDEMMTWSLGSDGQGWITIRGYDNCCCCGSSFNDNDLDYCDFSCSYRESNICEDDIFGAFSRYSDGKDLGLKSGNVVGLDKEKMISSTLCTLFNSTVLSNS